MRTCVRMVVCVLYPPLRPPRGPRGQTRALLSEPVALAPEAGREQMIGEVLRRGRGVRGGGGHAHGGGISRCPALRLVPPTGGGTRALARSARSDRVGRRGTGVRASRRRLLRGGRDARHPRRGPRGGARGHPPGIGAQRPPRCRTIQVRRLLRRPGGPFAASFASGGGGGKAARFLAPLPAALLRSRPELATLPDTLDRLGIRTLGELAALPSRAVAERFGHPGLLALDLARGRDTPLEPRRPPEPVSERIELPEAASGQQLERALELLVARVLARRERRGRSLRAVAVSARFAAGGTWREVVTLRHASADPGRIRIHPRPQAGGAAGTGGIAGDRGRGLRPAGAGSGPVAGGGGAARRARLERRYARPAKRRATPPRCGCLTWTRTPASPSAARCSRRSWTGHPSGGGGEDNGQATEARGATPGARARGGERRPGRHRLHGGGFRARGVGGGGPLVDARPLRRRYFELVWPTDVMSR